MLFDKHSLFVKVVKTSLLIKKFTLFVKRLSIYCTIQNFNGCEKVFENFVGMEKMFVTYIFSLLPQCFLPFKRKCLCFWWHLSSANAFNLGNTKSLSSSKELKVIPRHQLVSCLVRFYNTLCYMTLYKMTKIRLAFNPLPDDKF